MSQRQPVRVAYADHASEVGGAEISLALLLERLDRARYEPVVLHSPDARWLDGVVGPSQAATIDVFQDARLMKPRRQDIGHGLLGNLDKLLSAVGPVLQLRRVLRAQGVRLVHSNTLKCHMLAGTAARLCRLPLIWHMRDLVNEPGAWSVLAYAARLMRPTVIAISQAVASHLRDLPVRVHVVHNGVPLDDFKPGPPDRRLMEELGLEPDDRVIMIVARLTPWKGHTQLIQAMPQVLARFPRAKLVVVGSTHFWDPDYMDELKQLASALRVSGAIIWTGHRDDVPDLLRLCEVFVLPSKDEPFGRSLVEAMATSKPVVAGAGGATREICPDGVCGYLVDPDSPDDIAQALMTLLDSPQRAQDMGRAGLERARTLFDADATAARIQAVYDDLLS